MIVLGLDQWPKLVSVEAAATTLTPPASSQSASAEWSLSPSDFGLSSSRRRGGSG